MISISLDFIIKWEFKNVFFLIPMFVNAAPLCIHATVMFAYEYTYCMCVHVYAFHFRRRCSCQMCRDVRYQLFLPTTHPVSQTLWGYPAGALVVCATFSHHGNHLFSQAKQHTQTDTHTHAQKKRSLIHSLAHINPPCFKQDFPLCLYVSSALTAAPASQLTSASASTPAAAAQFTHSVASLTSRQQMKKFLARKHSKTTKTLRKL